MRPSYSAAVSVHSCFWEAQRFGFAGKHLLAEDTRHLCSWCRRGGEKEEQLRLEKVTLNPKRSVTLTFRYVQVLAELEGHGQKWV